MAKKKEDQKTEKNLGGRPKIPIDWKTLEGLCQIQCTEVECAAVLKIHLDTLAVAIKEEFGYGFPEYLKNHSGKGRASLRRLQWGQAQGGNTTMLIWLGKQWLAQADKTELSGKDGGPIKTHQMSTDELMRIAEG